MAPASPLVARVNRERRLYDLPQNDTTDVPGRRSGDLSPRHKNLTTILMARKGMLVEGQWERLDRQ